MSRIQRTGSVADTMAPEKKAQLDEAIDAAKRRLEPSDEFQQSARPPAAPVGFKLESDRMKAIYRLMYHMAVSVEAVGVHSVFSMTRCYALFLSDLIQTDKNRDQEAMVAGSKEDEFLIHVIEVCSKRVGFAILRTLALVREFGSSTSKQMGLYALIGSNNTLSDFVSLARLVWIDATMYTFTQFKSVNVVKSMVGQQEQLLAKFANLHSVPMLDITYRVVMYEPPKAEDPSKVSVFARHSPKDDDDYTKQALLANQQWPALLKWARMLRQASQIDAQEQAMFDSAENLFRLIYMAQQPDMGLHLDTVLQGGSGLFRAAIEILHQLSDALNIERQSFDSDKVDLFDLIQKAFIRRVKFTEAVFLRYCLDGVYSKRTDSRDAILRLTKHLLQADLDYLVADLHKNELSA